MESIISVPLALTFYNYFFTWQALFDVMIPIASGADLQPNKPADPTVPGNCKQSLKECLMLRKLI